MTPWTAACQATLSFTVSRSCSNPCPLSRWCHPTISSFVIPFSCPQSLPASGSFPMSQFFTLGGQSIGTSASASVLPINIQDWFPLGWTHLISSLSKGLLRVFSSSTVQEHPFFSSQPSLWSNTYICGSRAHLLRHKVKSIPSFQLVPVKIQTHRLRFGNCYGCHWGRMGEGIVQSLGWTCIDCYT